MTLVSDKFPILKCSELPDIIVEREAKLASRQNFLNAIQNMMRKRQNKHTVPHCKCHNILK